MSTPSSVNPPRVPLLDLKPQNSEIEAELIAVFETVLKSGIFILGRDVEQFEERIAELSGTKHGIGVSSGTDALLLALMALDIGPGDEVICPTFTFFATAGCIVRVGAKPVFTDACPVCFNIDVADFERKITSRTKAVIPVHLFGQSAEMDGVMEVAGRHNLSVIEDAAQSMGAGYRGRRVGSIGDFGTYSFFPSKNLGGFGDAGMLVTNDDTLAKKARVLRNHGMEPKYHHLMVGGNFRIDALQSALLSVKVPHYRDYCRKRAENAAFYTQELARLDAVAVADVKECGCRITPEKGTPDEAKLILPIAYPHNEHIWNQYTLRVRGSGRRDALRTFLGESGIGCEIYYPRPMHRQECFASLNADASTLTNADILSQEVLSIPVYPELTREMQLRVIEILSEFLQS